MFLPFSISTFAEKSKSSTLKIVAIVVPTAAIAVLFLILGCYCFAIRSAKNKYKFMNEDNGNMNIIKHSRKKEGKKKGKKKEKSKLSYLSFVVHVFVPHLTTSINTFYVSFGCVAVDIITIESLQCDFATIEAATNNFSLNNKLGQGGFGDVYKVIKK